MKLTLRYAILFKLVLMVFQMTPVIAQTGVARGRVKLNQSKTHEGVKVRIAKVKAGRTKASTAEEDTQEVQTDNKGDYEFTGLANGDYVFTFTKEGYQGFTTRGLEILSGETVKIRLIELKKEGDPYAEIRGAVFYGGGFTLPNALITIERIDGGKKFKQEKVSQEGGEFKFRLKAEKATYRISASAQGFQTASQELTIEGDEVRNIALTLQQLK